MRDRLREWTALAVIVLLTVALSLTLVQRAALERRNAELEGAIKQYIRAAALYAEENQRLAGQLSWCLNTPLAGTHPQGQDAAEVRREQSLAGSSPE